MPNLVANPGFEETVRTYCSWTQDPAKFNANMSAWSSPTQTTPDHFSTNNDPDCWAHPTKHSKQGTHDGSGMVGIKTYGKGNTPTYWHEYVQGTLPGTVDRRGTLHRRVLGGARTTEQRGEQQHRDRLSGRADRHARLPAVVHHPA
ncbi:MAG: hypothetical protein IPH63_10490 [Flavobacteriales bacterium]|nr:hypothetical protein [Flavobacteriales bacterium]